MEDQPHMAILHGRQSLLLPPHDSAGKCVSLYRRGGRFIKSLDGRLVLVLLEKRGLHIAVLSRLGIDIEASFTLEDEWRSDNFPRLHTGVQRREAIPAQRGESQAR